ncbi:hypothetical protein ACF073_06050 [Streptomyces sp. NPDC015171]
MRSSTSRTAHGRRAGEAASDESGDFFEEEGGGDGDFSEEKGGGDGG